MWLPKGTHKREKIGNKPEIIYARISQEKMDTLKKLAHWQKKSLSYLVDDAITEYLERRGKIILRK